MKSLIYPVILAGGSGTRLWPLSREKYPKQFIPIIDGNSLFQETIKRFSDPLIFAPPIIVTHKEHRFLVRDQLNDISITASTIITEPKAKNTAAACLSAAIYIKKTFGNVPILFTPADHIVIDASPLFLSIQSALPFVLNDKICIFGITPTSPHTGYGYITSGKELAKGVNTLEAFIEKPNKERAEEIIKKGAYWNSGLYFCTPGTLVHEASLYTEELLTTLTKYFSKKNAETHSFVMIDEATYDEIDPISIDKGITEHSKNLIVAPTSIVWSDLGSWQSLYNHFSKNSDGNVMRGDSMAVNSRNSYIESSGRLVTVFGLDNTGVVETSDAVMVFSLHDTESIKYVVSSLSSGGRKEVITHTTVHRPWGQYSLLGGSPQFQSKKITVLPGAELSLQRHTKRAEHWIVVNGIATVTRGDEHFTLRPNESTFIPMGTIHRLANKHEETLILIEIQTGNYFGEDDIERFEDVYGRK